MRRYISIIISIIMIISFSAVLSPIVQSADVPPNLLTSNDGSSMSGWQSDRDWCANYSSLPIKSSFTPSPGNDSFFCVHCAGASFTADMSQIVNIDSSQYAGIDAGGLSAQLSADFWSNNVNGSDARLMLEMLDSSGNPFVPQKKYQVSYNPASPKVGTSQFSNGMIKVSLAAGTRKLKVTLEGVCMNNTYSIIEGGTVEFDNINLIIAQADSGAAPTISSINDQETCSGLTLGPLAVAVDDTDTPVDSLVLEAASTNTLLIPTNNITFGGSGKNRTCSLTSVSGQIGEADITISVKDAMNITSITFHVTVYAHAPVGSNLVLNGDASQAPGGGNVYMPGWSIQSDYANFDVATGKFVVIAHTTSTVYLNQLIDISWLYGLADTSQMNFTASAMLGGNATLIINFYNASGTSLLQNAYTITGSTWGMQTIQNSVPSDARTVKVTISGKENAQMDDITFVITNDFPKISVISNRTIASDKTSNPIPFNIGYLEGDPVLTATSSNTTIVPNGNIVFGGTEFQRTLTVTPVMNAVGNTIITVSANFGAQTRSTGFTLTTVNPSKVVSVAKPASKTYKVGEKLDFTIGFSSPVTVNTGAGTPYLPITLDTGGTVNASYMSVGSNATSLLFSYTVQAGDFDADGITLSPSIVLNNGDIRDNTLNATVPLNLNGAGSTSGILVDGVPPTIISADLSASNTYIDITFSEGIYANANATAPIDNSKLTLILNKNGGNISELQISSVKKNDKTVEAQATGLTGGEKTVRVFLNATGTSKGVETLEIKPSGASSLFDVFGNAAAASQTTGLVNFHDLTPPDAPAMPAMSASSDKGISNSDGITSEISPNFTGTSEVGSTVRIYSSKDGSLGTTMSDLSGIWSFTVPSLSEGNHNIYVSASDAAGNISSPSAILAITVDLTAPSTPSTPDLDDSSDTGVSNADNLTKVANPLFSGTAEARSTVVLHSSVSGIIGTTTADIDGKWSITPSTPLANGSHSITVNSTDTAGNTGNDSAALVVRIDTSAPGITVSGPSATLVSNGTVAYTVDYTGADSITLTADDIILNKTGTANGSVTIAAAGPATRIVTIGGITGDGMIDISVKAGTASDNAGNITAAAGPAGAFTVDNTPPLVLISTPSALLTRTGSISYTVTFTSASSISLNSKDIILNKSGTADGSIDVSGSGTIERTVTISNINGDGTLGISVPLGASTDTAGNRSVRTGPSTAFTVDNTPPAAPAAPRLAATSDTGISDTDGITSLSILNLSGSAEPNSTVTIYSSTSGAIGTTTAGTGGTWSFTTPSLNNASYDITVTSTDAAGNASENSQPLSVTIDTTPPAAPTAPDMITVSDSGKSDTDNVTNVKTPVFTGTAEPLCKIELTTSPTDKIGSATADTSGKWSITASSLTDGTYTVSARSVDIAGNTSTSSGGLNITIDTTAPSVATIELTASSDTGLSASDGITNDDTPEFTGKAEAGSTVTLISTMAGIVAATTADGGGNWSIEAAHIPDGTYTATVENTDTAGNKSIVSNACTVTIDTIKPAYTISAKSKTVTSDEDVSFTLNYSGADIISLEKGDIDLIKTGTADGIITVSGSGTTERTVVISEITGDGTLGMDIASGTASDKAGNLALQSGSGPLVTVDNTAPVVSPGAISISGLSSSGVSLGWEKATDNICTPGALKYQVYQSKSNNLNSISEIETTGTAIGILAVDIDSIKISGLKAATTYYFNITVCDTAGNKSFYKASSVTTNAVIPPATSSDSTNQTGSSAPAPKDDPVINTRDEDLSFVSVQTVDNKIVTTVNLDENSVMSRLESAGRNSTVIMEVSNSSDVVTGQLSGETMQAMGKLGSTLEVRTDTITYKLPAFQLNMDAVSGQLGGDTSLRDIKVNITIAEPPAETVRIMKTSADNHHYSIVVEPVDFRITCTLGNKTVEIGKFNSYIERLVAIPDGIDPSQITTGIVLNSDGTFSHVPTTVINIEGKYYARINSLTNSTYSVISNTVSFNDIKKHWAKADIEDVAARLIMEGTGKNTFGPDKKITRGEFIDAVIRALGLKRSGMGSVVFNDVNSNCPYFDSISAAYQYKFIKGSGGGLFKPDSEITRQEAMTIISRVMPVLRLKSNITAKETAKLLSGYKDSSSLPSWAKNTVSACIRAGIMEGTNGKIMGGDSITKAQTAAVIRRMMKKAALI